MNSDRKRTHSNRFHYDYSQEGAFFVTLYVEDSIPALGQVTGQEVQLSASGEIAAAAWVNIPARFPQVELDEWIVMPDCLHGIILTMDAPTPNLLDSIIRAFKVETTAQANALNQMPGHRLWLESDYRHVIRSENALNALRYHIQTSPARWFSDGEINRI
jgi:putative transposase